MPHITVNSLSGTVLLSGLALNKPVNKYRSHAKTMKNFLSMPSRSVGRIWYHWPQYLTHSSVLLVWHSWHCTKLVKILSFISLFSCQMQQWFLLLTYLPLWCPPRLSSRHSALCHVYYSTQYSCFISFFKYAEDTQNFSSPPIHHISTPTSVTDKMLHNRSLLGWLPIFSLSTLLKLNLFLLDLNNNSVKYRTALSLQPTPLACLGFIFDEHLTLSDQITAHCTSCYYHIRELRSIRPYLTSKQPAPLPPP